MILISHDCPVCFEGMGVPYRRPTVLNACPHTVCFECIHKIAQSTRVVKCPTCRTVSYLNKCLVNSALAQLIAEGQAQVDPSPSGSDFQVVNGQIVPLTWEKGKEAPDSHGETEGASFSPVREEDCNVIKCLKNVGKFLLMMVVLVICFSETFFMYFFFCKTKVREDPYIASLANNFITIRLGVSLNF